MNSKKKFLLFFLLAGVLLAAAPLYIYALEWPRSPLGTQLDPSTTKLDGAIQYLFEWAVALGGIAVFIVLLYSGIQYMTSAGDPGKTSEARARIFSAVQGLVLLLSVVIILNTLNPELVKIPLPRFEPGNIRGITFSGLELQQINTCKGITLFQFANYDENRPKQEINSGEQKVISDLFGKSALGVSGSEGSFRVHGVNGDPPDAPGTQGSSFIAVPIEQGCAKTCSDAGGDNIRYLKTGQRNQYDWYCYAAVEDRSCTAGGKTISVKTGEVSEPECRV